MYWVTAGLGAGWFCESGFLQFIFWFQFSGSWNQGLLDLLLMLVGGFWCSLVIILECVELFAFFYGAGPLPLSPLNTMTGGTLTLVQLQCNCCDYSLIRRNGLAANGPTVWENVLPHLPCRTRRLDLICRAHRNPPLIVSVSHLR